MNMPMSKLARQNLILEMVKDEPLPSQDELRRRLKKAGARVTQATLSRDIKELGLVKSAEGYVAPGAISELAPPAPPLSHLLREFVIDIREAQNLVVVKTNPGSAQPVAAALDAASWPELVGTIAGDDTILLISSSAKSCQQLVKRIREQMA